MLVGKVFPPIVRRLPRCPLAVGEFSGRLLPTGNADYFLNFAHVNGDNYTNQTLHGVSETAYDNIFFLDESTVCGVGLRSEDSSVRTVGSV